MDYISVSVAPPVTISSSSVAARIVENVCQHVEVPEHVSPEQHVPSSVVMVHVGGHDPREPDCDGHWVTKVRIVPEHHLMVSVARVQIKLVVSSMVKGNSPDVIFTPNMWLWHPSALFLLLSPAIFSAPAKNIKFHNNLKLHFINANKVCPPKHSH